MLAVIEKKERYYVCVSNVHTVVTGYKDSKYRKVTNGALLATPDGVPLIWAAAILSGPKIHGRCSGPDLLESFFKEEQCSKVSHYFYGSTPSVLDALKLRAQALNPQVRVAGMFSPPFRPYFSPQTPLSTDEILDCQKINEANPDIVWVGLGAPKQEVWMARARSYLNAPLLVSVGAAFDLVAGTKIRAPFWMQKGGLEWLYRLLQEPKRLTSRYLKTNPIFVAGVLKQALLDKTRHA